MPSCAICGIEAPSDKHLRMHIKAKHDDRMLICEKCEVTCKGRRKLKTHMDSHREFTCKHCEKTIPYNSRSSHITKCVGDKKAIKCESCPAAFNTLASLKVHKTNKRCEIQCSICDKTLKSAFFLEKHISSVHTVEMQVVKTIEGHVGIFTSTVFRKDLHCTLCDFIATKSSKLKRHMIKHNPKPAKLEEKCPKCDMTFKYKSVLNRHIPTSHHDFGKGKSRSSQYRKLKKLRAEISSLKRNKQARKPRSYASPKLRLTD